MIEVKLVGCTTHDTLTAVSLPNLKFDFGRDNSASNWIRWNWHIKILLTFDSGQLEFEHCAMRGRFTPRIDEMEDSVVRPNALPELLVNTDSFR